MDSCLSLASKTIRACDGPSPAPISTSVSPFLPPPSAARVAGVGGGVSARAGDLLDRGVDALLEAAALAGPGGLGLGDALVGVLALEQPREVLLELGDLRLHRPRLLRVRLAQLLDLGPVALLGLEHAWLDPDLDPDQRVGGVLGGQRLHQLLALLGAPRRRRSP